MRMRIDGDITNEVNSNRNKVLKYIDDKKKIDFEIRDHDLEYFQKNGLLSLVDSLLPVTREIENRKFLRATKTKILDFHILKLVKEFENNDIKYIVFKGYAISKSLYSNSNDRPYADIDLIIDPSQKNKVIKIFSELNYSNPFDRDYSFTRGQIVRRKELTPHKIFIELDIHFFMIGNFILRNIYCFDELYKEKQNIKVQDRTINTISKYHAFIHCCIHYYFHHKKRDLLKDIWLYDIKLRSEDMDPKDIKNLTFIINEIRLGMVVIEVLEVVNQKFKLKNDFILEINNNVDKNDDYYDLKNSNPLSIYLKQIIKIDKSSDRFKFVYDTIIPDYKLLSLKYGGFKRNLYPIFILLRFFDITYDYGGRIVKNFWKTKSF